LTSILHRFEVKLSGHKVRQAFTFRRLSCLRFIAAALSEPGSLSPTVLAGIPAPFWKYVVKSFFEYRFNDMLHCILVKIFCSVFPCDHAPTISALVSSTKLVTLLLQHLKATDVPTGALLVSFSLALDVRRGSSYLCRI
jgi:hypothetical protein